MAEKVVELSVRLASIRNEKGLSQKQAAADLGISQALLSHYEKGIRECGLDFLSRASEYYGVSVDYLLGLTDDKDGIIPETVDEGDSFLKERLERDKKMTGSILPVLNKRLIFSVSNILYDMLAELDSAELTEAVSADILMSVYNAFRCVLLANPENSEDFFGVRDDYLLLLNRFRKKALFAILRASDTKNSACLKNIDKIKVESLEEEYGAILSSVNNIIVNCENQLKSTE